MTTNEIRPEGPLVAWYGDDFTGAAAVMEVLTFAGLPSVLFLELPTPAQLAEFPGIRGIGLASTARSMPPDWMQENLPGDLRSLAKLCNGIVHYKICSTLDSSPAVGSIGKAIEIGAQVFESEYVPILVAAPQMRRYQLFGHLFAGMGTDVFRLDRHPVMSHHPVTPMSESDVAKHLEAQSDSVSFDLLSLEKLQNNDLTLDDFSANTATSVTGLTIDSFDEDSESAAGAVIWNSRHKCRFVVGSQGVEFALVRHWQDQGLLEKTTPPQGIGRADKIAIVSGSVSQITAQQISWSRNHGYDCIHFDAATVCASEQDFLNEIERVVNKATAVISSGSDPLIYTAEGPQDPAVERFRTAIRESGMDAQVINQSVGEALGKILTLLIERNGLRRAVISGGDTAGYATRQLGIFALTALAPTIPGASIFRAHAEGQLDGLELALKGGQMGSPDFFEWVKNGGGPK